MFKWLVKSIVERKLDEARRSIENGQADKGLGQLCQIIESLETCSWANRGITKTKKEKMFFDYVCA